MIVKNEEDWVENAVSSVISLVQEVIIVDTGSTDRTLEKVSRFSPRVIHSEWSDHFGDARNISLEEARYPWILVLDADECIAKRDLPLIEKALEGPYDGYHLVQRNYVNENHVHGWQPNATDYPEGEPYRGFVDNPLIRLFRNDDKLRFEGAVHEIIDPTRMPKSLRFSSVPVVIHHFGKVRGQELVVRKQHLYLRLGRKKLEEDPTNAKAYLDYGIQLQELGKHSEAREPFLKSFEMSGNPVSLLFCALAEKNVGNQKAAGDLLDKAARKGLDTFELHLERGNVWLATGEYGRARKSYQKCLERNIPNPVATFNIGLTYKKTGQMDKAAKYYSRARDMDPSFVAPTLELATIHTDGGRFAEAATLLEDLLAIRPEHRDVRLALVKAYFQLKRVEVALELLGDRFAGDPVAESLRGAAYLEQGENDKARIHLEAAIRGDSSMIDARINVSQVYGNQGEFARAARHLRHGYEKTGNPGLLPALSIHEARAGLFDDALVHLDEVIASGQAGADHWIYRSLILERKQKWDELAEHYRVMRAEVPELRDWVGRKQRETRNSASLSSVDAFPHLRAVPSEGSPEG